MEQRLNTNDAPLKDAQIIPNEEGCVYQAWCRSEFDKTTLTHPNQRTPAASASQTSVPEEVAVCVVVTENYEEV